MNNEQYYGELIRKAVPAEVPGWEVHDLSKYVGPTCINYLNRVLGLSLTASAKAPRTVHSESGIFVSIGIIRDFRQDITVEEHEKCRDQEIPGILKSFFGETQFEAMADHPACPTLKHFFSIRHWNQN